MWFYFPLNCLALSQDIYDRLAELKDGYVFVDSEIEISMQHQQLGPRTYTIFQTKRKLRLISFFSFSGTEDLLKIKRTEGD